MLAISVGGIGLVSLQRSAQKGLVEHMRELAAPAGLSIADFAQLFP
jgi:hypothetical protein